MDGKGTGTGGHEHFPNHEKDAASKRLENSKNETNHFSPLESTAKLSEENKKPDTNEPEDTSKVKPDSPTSSFGPEWGAKQLDIIRKSGYLTTQRLENRRLETDAKDRLSETKIQNSTPEQTTIHRVAESAYRLVEDYMKYLGRS